MRLKGEGSGRVTQTRDLQAAILGRDDLQGMQSSDEGTEGAHLPQETKVAVPQVQSGQDAGASVVRFEVTRARADSCRAPTGSPQSGGSPPKKLLRCSVSPSPSGRPGFRRRSIVCPPDTVAVVLPPLTRRTEGQREISPESPCGVEPSSCSSTRSGDSSADGSHLTHPGPPVEAELARSTRAGLESFNVLVGHNLLRVRSA